MSFKIRETHWEILLDFMSTHPDLARGRLNTAQARKNYNSMWAELTTQLNSVGVGQKPVEKWQKSWSDYKVNLKKKAAAIEHSRLLTGGGPGTGKSLTEFELKILSLLGDSFYKGIGVKEVGIITSQEPRTNLDINDSEPLSLEILATRKPNTIVSSVISTTKKIETQTSKRTREQEDLDQESMSLLSLKKPMQDILQQPVCSIDQKLQIPFRKKTKNDGEYLVNLSGPSDTKKNPSRVFTNDHDYLANLPGQSSARKTSGKRSKNDENDTIKIYADTLNVLHSINNNVNRVANNLENLVSEFKTCPATFKEVLENLKPNLNLNI